MNPVLVAVIVIVLLIAAVIIGWPYMLRYFIRNYYEQHYKPVRLTQADTQNVPPEHHLTNLPWITSPWQLCQSTSLQMIAAQQGIDYPRANHDFLMGFTYGASSLPGAGFMPLGSDPEIGFEQAAPYLSLQRKYYVTDDAQLFVSALRSFLAQGYAVRLALDEGTLYGKKAFLAHSEVLAGYDTSGFYYYETVALPPADVQPGTRPAGEKGLRVSDETLLAAVRRFAEELNHPWRYALTVFEPGPQNEDLRPVWLANGKAMVEDIKYGPKMGVRVIEFMADDIRRQGTGYDTSKALTGLELAVQVRRDNAGFLRSNFPLHADLLEAADLMEQAAECYRQACDAMHDGIANAAEGKRIADQLFDAAIAERKVGEIFIKRGELPFS